jgi:hypothetical protein
MPVVEVVDQVKGWLESHCDIAQAQRIAFKEYTAQLHAAGVI